MRRLAPCGLGGDRGAELRHGAPDFAPNRLTLRLTPWSNLHVSAEAQDEDDHDDVDDQESKRGIVGVNQEITGFTRRKPLCYIIGAI
jgi:hypothetical protein